MPLLGASLSRPDSGASADGRELKGNVIQLEGRDLIVVEVGHTDTDHTTCLLVPSIGLVVAGDAVYNDVHLYLAESDSEARRAWVAALDKIDSLKPRAVIAGHKKPDNTVSPQIIEETRQYIRNFDRLAETTIALENFTTACWTLSDPGQSGSLWGAARAEKESK